MLAGVLALAAMCLIAPFYLVVGLIMGIHWIVKQLVELNNQRRARIEVELDRKQAELRGTILNLADALGMEAHEARKALIRESYRVSGQTPNRPE